jgi:ABC-type multidrug transport system fused ATPase/permease subunit
MPPTADAPIVQFERLVIENGANSVAFDLHPRLTVIAGLTQMERDGLVNEFVGALGNSRSGIHLELVAGNGNRFAIFRPTGAPHRVIDVDNRLDVTQQFTDATGSIDLLSRAGLDARTARRIMRFGAQDLAETTERGAYIQQLARIEQNELWAAAEALVIADRRLEEEADAVGSNVEDAEVIERIERHHEQFERSQAESEKVRRVTFLAAGFAALLAVPAAALIGTLAVVPLGLVALAAVATSIVYWRRMERARAAEEEALADAGAQSYLGFHLQRVNSLLSSDLGRQRLIRAAEEHRQAAQRWHALAGDVDVNWAIANRAEITSAARLRADVQPFVTPEDPSSGDQTAAAAHAVLARLEQLRSLGPGWESFPALLDEPFQHLDDTILPAMLELLVRSSEHQQIILLSESAAVAEWARVEAMTGAIGVIEPSSIVRPTSAV